MQNIKKVLIANRGEIACRIARTCRRLGLGVASVHSSVDRNSRHVREIGDSIEIGGAAPAESYLNIDAIVAAAKRAGAGAIHPGYGFASENPAFVRAAEAAGLIFVGPTAETMERLGGKAAAKREAARLGIPVVPGGKGGMADRHEIARLIETMPMPVLLKAVAGGGGRGMAVIAELEEAGLRVESAMREAEKAFGSGELIVERYLPRVRHIEVQIAGDGKGKAIHLFERECTLQRRHQKVIEEAPCAGLPAGLRERLLDSAVRLAEAVHYRNLGTVEFIVGDGEYFFLEVNPRLQVEHPVTEEVTGIDLVELQLRIADGNGLPFDQHAVRIKGHAIEARVCAEDPESGFLPATGRLDLADFSGAGVRVESGVETGDEISPHYDSMIAKLIAHGPARGDALTALRGALARSSVCGVATNLGFLQELLAWPETADGSFHTRLIDERGAGGEGAAQNAAPPDEHVSAAALFWLGAQRARTPPYGCWSERAGFTGWRLGTGTAAPAPQPALDLRAAGGRHWLVRYGAPGADGTALVALGDTMVRAGLSPLGGARHLLFHGGRMLEVSIADNGNEIGVVSPLGSSVLQYRPYLGGALGEAASDGQLVAPMMGKIVAIQAKPGDTVKAGQTIVVLESMKMELRVTASIGGRVAALRCGAGDMVERHQVLGEIEPA